MTDEAPKLMPSYTELCEALVNADERVAELEDAIGDVLPKLQQSIQDSEHMKRMSGSAGTFDYGLRAIYLILARGLRGELLT